MSDLFTQLLLEEDRRHSDNLARLFANRALIEQLDAVRPQLQAGGVDVEVPVVRPGTHEGREYLLVRLQVADECAVDPDTRDMPLLRRLLVLGAVVDDTYLFCGRLSVYLSLGELRLLMWNLTDEARQLFPATAATTEAAA